LRCRHSLTLALLMDGGMADLRTVQPGSGALCTLPRVQQAPATPVLESAGSRTRCAAAVTGRKTHPGLITSIIPAFSNSQALISLRDASGSGRDRCGRGIPAALGGNRWSVCARSLLPARHGLQGNGAGTPKNVLSEETSRGRERRQEGDGQGDGAAVRFAGGAVGAVACRTREGNK
jgi:hypothetical protein